VDAAATKVNSRGLVTVIIMHARQFIIMTNNALWAAVQTAGVVLFTVLLHDGLAYEWAWPYTKVDSPFLSYFMMYWLAEFLNSFVF